jgi:hypothetical protein
MFAWNFKLRCSGSDERMPFVEGVSERKEEHRPWRKVAVPEAFLNGSATSAVHRRGTTPVPGTNQRKRSQEKIR